jgi:hypothetical protein
MITQRGCPPPGVRWPKKVACFRKQNNYKYNKTRMVKKRKVDYSYVLFSIISLSLFSLPNSIISLSLSFSFSLPHSLV